MVVVAAVALVVDLGTAALLFAMSRGNLNLRAAYLHNLGDAISSVGVILAGAAVLLWGAYWVDRGRHARHRRRTSSGKAWR